jgi:metal-responsive CopG/Arc/MetJ family transcriptional regulator
MFSSKVKIDKELLKKIKKYAQIAGYSSADEFIMHALEKEIKKIEAEETDSEEKIKNRLRGLGYIS